MRLIQLMLVALISFLLVACPGGESQVPESTVELVESEPMVEEKPAVCIWDKGSVREAPKKNGKWMSAMALGEKITWTGYSEVDSANNNRKYYKIRLSDGSEGWASEYVVALDSEPAVVLAETAVFRRPDYLTVTDHKLAPMEVVAISEARGEWAQVMAAEKKRQGWIETGLVSKDPVDIAVGLMATKAMALDDEDKRNEKLQEILDNQAFAASTFISKIKNRMDGNKEVDFEENDVPPDSM